MALGRATPLAALEATVLDLETTSLDARQAWVIEIGTVRVAQGAVDAKSGKSQLVNPGVAIPPETIAVHGITDQDVASAPSFRQIGKVLGADLSGQLIVGHTIDYDLMVLDREAVRAELPWRRPRSLDVRTLAEIALPGLAQYSLDRIAEALKVTIGRRHRALDDAKATAEVFVALLPHLRQRGIRTLGELETASEELFERKLSAGQVSALRGPKATNVERVLARIDSFPFRHRIGDVMSAPAVTCDAQATLEHVLAMLIERKVSSVIVEDHAMGPGLLTERDVLRVLQRDGPSALPRQATGFATRPISTIDTRTHVYRAIGRMDRLGIRHLPVTDEAGQIVGMVTTRNLLRHRATATIALGDRIDSAENRSALASAWGDLVRVVRALRADGVDPIAIAEVISTEVCAMTQRAAALAEQALVERGLGAAPVPYAVLVLGSAGRGESLLAADQDNAIIHAGGPEGSAEDQWFLELAKHFTETLDLAGVPFCKGGVMATNAIWRRNESDWVAAVGAWIERRRPEDLLNVDIFFDAVAVAGDEAMAERLVARAYALASKDRAFQDALGLNARQWTSPLTMFGRLKTDQSGRVDLKRHGLFPVFAAARILAIRHGVTLRGTHARLKAVAPKASISERDLERVLDAHRVVVGVMLDQQLADIEAGLAPSTKVDPKRLDGQEFAALKTALQSVDVGIAALAEGRA
ncbi:MAG: hypothetical protein RL291_605 [Pseudomonadota bacterium]